MKFVVKMLQGGQTRQEAITARVQSISAIGERSSGYSFKTVKSGGFAQTQLYPTAGDQPASQEKKELHSPT